MIDEYTGHLNYCVPSDGLALGAPPGTQGLCESEGHRVKANTWELRLCGGGDRLGSTF